MRDLLLKIPPTIHNPPPKSFDMDLSVSATTITSLPIELVQAIARDCDKADIPSLRLACRDISAKVDDVFLDNYFTERQHLITVYSLNVLVEICGHARFRRKLRELAFVPVDINQRYRPLDEPCAEEEAFVRFSRSSPLSDTRRDELIRENDAKRERWNSWVAQVKSLSDDGLACKLICSALKSLANAGITPTLIVRSVHSIMLESPYGYRQLQKALGCNSMREDGILYSYDIYGRSSCARNIAPCVLTAVASSAFPVRKLVLNGLDHGFSLACFHIDAASLPALSSVIVNLQSLRLCTLAWMNEHAIGVFKMLLQASNHLRTLELDFYMNDWEREGDESIILITNSMPENRLESIKINTGVLDDNVFLSFLEKQRKSLKAIEITHTCMARPERWHNVFQQLAGTPQLQKVRLARLFLDGWHYRLRESDALDVSGSEEVRAGLKLLIETAKFKPFPWEQDEDDDESEEEDSDEHNDNAADSDDGNDDEGGDEDDDSD